jgi:hypothetical protein
MSVYKVAKKYRPTIRISKKPVTLIKICMHEVSMRVRAGKFSTFKKLETGDCYPHCVLILL